MRTILFAAMALAMATAGFAAHSNKPTVIAHYPGGGPVPMCPNPGTNGNCPTQ